MVLYGVYYGAYKIANFYISAFSAFHHTSFYTKKRLHIRISVYFDHFIRVLYERRYASHMLHHHLCTVTYLCIVASAPAPLHRHGGSKRPVLFLICNQSFSIEAVCNRSIHTVLVYEESF